jgi:ABC-2 type transport system ATP-binding protein
MTTHYMDEAERCHRLAFIFRGRLLDVGTPGEIVRRRDLSVAELEVERATEAAELLRARPEVDAVSHYGHTLRVATRGTDAGTLIQTTLAGHEIRDLHGVRASVEDAFVSMVRAEAA